VASPQLGEVWRGAGAAFEMKNEKCKIRNEKVIQFRIAGSVFALCFELAA
jgi:hypothetical protein